MDDLIITSIGLICSFVVPVLLLLAGIFVGGARERSHLRSLNTREQALRHVLQSNMRMIPTHWHVTNAALVTGECVIATDYFKVFLSTWRKFFGGELRAYESLLLRARREAVLRMVEGAVQEGANAVINIRMDTSSVGRNQGNKGMAMAEVIAYGTALHIENK